MFFIITNIEHDIIPNNINVSLQDSYLGSTVGELGCWIDVGITRLIQRGVEHLRVPDIGTYLGAGKFFHLHIFSGRAIS